MGRRPSAVLYAPSPGLLERPCVAAPFFFGSFRTFVHSPLGDDFRRKIMHSRRSARRSWAGDGSGTPGGSSAAQLVPRWDDLRRELVVHGQIVKRFRLPAPYQEAVLAAFEEEGWPPRVFDPLSPQGDQDPEATAARDHQYGLNRSRLARIIRFRGDGTGQGVLWEWVPRLALIPPPRSTRPPPQLR